MCNISQELTVQFIAFILELNVNFLIFKKIKKPAFSQLFVCECRLNKSNFSLHYDTYDLVLAVEGDDWVCRIEWF
ncbi:hypothetical protein SB6413_02245 [Klebsiella pasteurii]|nr:hypothetical protein SB6413_02245 [Klebsiella pasteurii]